MELDTRIATLCARAQDDPQRAYPTFALALALFDNPSWDVLSPERPLRYWRLIEINQPEARPLTTSPLRADERIVNYIKGLNYLDDRLASFAMPVVVDEELEDQAQLPPSQQHAVAAIVRYWQQAVRSSSFPLIQLVGPDAPSKQLVAYHTARIVAGHLYRIPLELLPTQPTELVHLARLWQRESRLLPLALYLDAQEIDLASPEGQALALSRFLAHSKGFFFLGTRETLSHLGLSDLVLDVGKPTQAEQREIWTTVLEDVAPDSPPLLAGQFNLSQPIILRIAHAELDENAGDEASLPERLWDACCMNARPRLDILAQRLEPKVSWEDLVLPDEETNMLHQIADQVRQRNQVYETWGFADKTNRGLGINALFAGESGTGKTMAAEVIAHSLHLNLYRIDLSAVVSKYIGETEKICAAFLMLPKTEVPFSSSTRPTPFLASAAKSKTAMIAMPISRSTTSYSVWKPIVAWPSWQPTSRAPWIPHFCAVSVSLSISHFPARKSANVCGRMPFPLQCPSAVSISID